MNTMYEQMILDYELNETVKRVDESLKKDFNGSRRKYADEVSTSQALRKRRMAYLARHNGHG